MPLIAWAQIFVEAGHKACGCNTQNGRNFNLLSMFPSITIVNYA